MKTLTQVQTDHVELVQNLPGYRYTKFELHERKNGADMSIRSMFDGAVAEPSTEAWFNTFGVVAAACEKLTTDMRKVETVKSSKLLLQHNIRRMDDRAELVFVVHLKKV